MSYLQILVLAIIQGACELLPVSSSAHVVIAEKLMGLDPSSPAMTMLLVMLHTGTMFAMIVFFWSGWKRDYFSSPMMAKDFVIQVIVATIFTGIVGLGLKIGIEKVVMHSARDAEVENLFSNLPLIAGALAAVGLLIIYAGFQEGKASRNHDIQLHQSVVIGIIQGLSLPFRGFSRSGSTISAGLIFGLPKKKLEEFSFALAVVITPAIMALEGYRLLKKDPQLPFHPSFGQVIAHAYEGHRLQLFMPGLKGMGFSFLAGLLALKWLSRWLEGGRWKFFGFYCLVAAGVVLAIH